MVEADRVGSEAAGKPAVEAQQALTVRRDANRHPSRGSKLKYISIQKFDQEITSSMSSLVTAFNKGFVRMVK